jgi:hypothetical protein
MRGQKIIKRTRRYNKTTRRYNKTTRRYNKRTKRSRKYRIYKIKGGAPPSFQAKLIEIQNAQPGKIIKINIKLYREPVKLESSNAILQVNQKLEFKDFLKDSETLTPSDQTGAVEDLYNWTRDELTPNPTPNPNNMTHGLCRLFVNDEYTGQQLVLIGKPTQDELENDNEDVESGETMDIVFIFRKWPLPVPAGAAPVPAPAA